MLPPVKSADSEACTACDLNEPIVLRGQLAKGVPYRLCRTCAYVYARLCNAESEQFTAELFDKAAVKSLKPAGRA
jgi:hypothetical protein